MQKIILHSDLNNFYASVECLLNPSLKNKPVAVCGNPEARHGIVLAKNQIAKKYGVSTAETIWQAKLKCPDLVVVSPNYDRYLTWSKMAREIYERYTDRIESFGIDECWLDVTGSTALFGNGEQIAEKIRTSISSELGITVSIGVSFNKIFAKLGSDMKKPDAITIITPENFKQNVWVLPVEDLLYVGRATKRKLYNLNIKTIGELANTDEAQLCRHLGKWASVLIAFANGKDQSVVKKREERDCVKSVGNSMTAPRDLETLDDVRCMFYMLSDSVAARLRQYKLKCSAIQIHIRDKELISCERQAQLNNPSFISSEIAEAAIELFQAKYSFKNPLRSVGVSGINLVDASCAEQLSFFFDDGVRQKKEALEFTVDKIRERYGHASIIRGIVLSDADLVSLNPKDDHVIHPVSFFDGRLPV